MSAGEVTVMSDIFFTSLRGKENRFSRYASFLEKMSRPLKYSKK